MNRVPSPVSVLVTWDIDPDSWLSVETRLKALESVRQLCAAHDISATFFFTAKLAETYQHQFGPMQEAGHEIGCHGLTHGNEENYDRMPQDQQLTYIQQSTEALQTLIGGPLRTFRSPRVKISALTLRLLAEYGYRADSSVCSQRMDVLSSNLINPGWLIAPRRPYHPHTANAFRAGDVPLWEIPISAVIVPFISTTMRVFGLGAMKTLFKLLYWEARYTGKPIVYLAHPTEFLGKTGNNPKAWRQFVRLRELKPSYIRTHGLRMRNLLYIAGGQKLLDYTNRLFAYMSSFPGVTFMTVNEYVTHLEKVK
ncbi:MAG: hypothetical protein DRI81_04585 [Chloroflexi bacterium]|nr:MAG: hypothetical protein DRI81_04585 [Chloroflexota bacterium]